MAALPLVLVAAVADNGVIGNDNRLIWRLKTDMKRFRALTMGCPVIMGRKTFVSIGKPLPGRQTIVLTRDPAFRPEGAHVATSLGDALGMAQGLGQAAGAHAVIVGGGTDIYAQALPLVDRLELTLVHATPDGDAVFPYWDRAAFRETSRVEHLRGAEDEHDFSFVTLDRRA